MLQLVLKDKIIELNKEIEIIKEIIISQNKKIKSLQNKINCLELDEIIAINEVY